MAAFNHIPFSTTGRSARTLASVAARMGDDVATARRVRMSDALIHGGLNAGNETSALVTRCVR